MCYASHRVSGKTLCIVLPVSAVATFGFEHSVANMYLIPLGMLADAGMINRAALPSNLIPATLGNVIGGSVFVALVYWIVYLQADRERDA